MPRKRFNFAVQVLFDLFIQNAGLFENVTRTKEKIVIIYDLSDELVNFQCSSYCGIIFLFSKISHLLRKNKTKIKTKNKEGYWNYLLTLPTRLKTTENAFNMHLQFMKKLEPLISRNNIDEMNSAFLRLFSLIKNIDINTYMEDSTRLCRSSSSRYNLGQIMTELEKFANNSRDIKQLQKGRAATEGYEYDLKDLLAVLENFSNGLKEIFIKFVKFTNRLNVCSLSLFDIYYMKKPDVSYLIMLLWTMQFMEEISLVDPTTNHKSKFDFTLLRISKITRHR
jgi:hypothetical protein